jgi:hypothetical protein
MPIQTAIERATGDAGNKKARGRLPTGANLQPELSETHISTGAVQALIRVTSFVWCGDAACAGNGAARRAGMRDRLD